MRRSGHRLSARPEAEVEHSSGLYRCCVQQELPRDDWIDAKGTGTSEQVVACGSLRVVRESEFLPADGGHRQPDGSSLAQRFQVSQRPPHGGGDSPVEHALEHV